MASTAVTQPSYFAREAPTVTAQGDLLTITFPGGELTMPPHQFLVLLERGKNAYNEWSLLAACRDVVAWDREQHKVIKFPAQRRIVRLRNGGQPA